MRTCLECPALVYNSRQRCWHCRQRRSLLLKRRGYRAQKVREGGSGAVVKPYARRGDLSAAAIERVIQQAAAAIKRARQAA